LLSYDVFKTSQGQLKPVSEITSILRESGIALMQWEKDTRDQLLAQKLAEQTAVQVPVDEAWVSMENRVRGEKITFEYATLSPDTNAVADPGDGTLESYLKAGGARFQYGPRRILQYVALDQTALGDAVKVDDAAIQSAYESRKSQFTELDASHILFRAKTETEFMEATKKAEELQAKLAKGGDFGKVAAEVSEDPTAKANKGRLGWFKIGAMVKPFEDGAMALKIGEVSGPVRTSFGIHLIKLEGRKEKALEEVKEELRTQMMQDRFSTLAKDRLEQLRKRAGDKGDLATAAKTLNLTVETSQPLMDDPGSTLEKLPESAFIVKQAFEMKLQEVSKVQQVGNRFVVFRVQEEKPIAVPPLAEIRGKVLAAWKLEEARKKSTEKAQAALQAQNLASLATITTKENAIIQSLGPMGEHPALRKALLDTAVGAFTPILWNAEGQIWVARIKARTPAEPLTFEKRMMIVQNIQASVSRDLLEAQREDLDAKGRLRPGFSSLWGRFDGIWMNPAVSFENQELPLGLGQ
jgi:peptidyl-prolyl cis-trans isomerase D